MFSDLENNKEIVKGAYRKLKSYYYYNRNFLIMRKKITEFEADRENMEETFDALSYLLAHPRSKRAREYMEKIVGSIDFVVLPKKFDAESMSGNKPVSNTIMRDKKLKAVNFFICGAIEIYLLDTIWALVLSKIAFDNRILSYDVYGNTVNVSAVFQNGEINFENRLLFNRYFFKYTDWRNKAFDELERLYDRKKDALLVSLDIKSYFYSVAFDFSKIETLFGKHDLFNDVKPLTSFMQACFESYYLKISRYRVDLPTLKKNAYILPIGLFSSMVLGNIYLAEFDRRVRANKDITYYGRYVDDMLFVINKSISPEKTNLDIIQEVFVDTEILNYNGSYYSLYGYPDLHIQAEKIKTIYIDHNESKAMIDIYNDTIRIVPSQMNPLPEDDLNLNNFDEVAYTVENFTKEAKLRELGRFGVDSFKVGKYFTCLAHRYAHVSTMGEVNVGIERHISQIRKFFSGSQGVEYYTNWLNYMYFLVITQRNKQLREFVSDMRREIANLKGTSLDKKMYARTATINKKVKDTLNEHLNVCLYLSLSLDVDMVDRHFKSYKDVVSSYMEANMFDHSLIAFPLANYLVYDKDVSYVKMPIKEIGKFPKSKENWFKFIWSPRFIHYDELSLVLFYFYYRYPNKAQKFEYVKNELLDKFCEINHMKYSPFQIVEEKQTSFDEYDLSKIQIPSLIGAKPKEVNIAVGSLNIDAKKCMKGCSRWANITLSEKTILDEILRESFNCFSKKRGDVMLLVLPELCFPIYWIGELIAFSKRSQIAVITGLQYMGDDSGRMHNYLATLLPFTVGKKRYKNVFVHIREKNDYSPIEFEGLAQLGYSCKNREKAEYQVFSWNNINLSTLVCYELTDVVVRALLKGRCDIIAAPVFNPDTTYFSNIIDATTRDLHAFIVQANTSFYGDSRVTGPYDRDSKDIFKIKGGDNDHVVIGSIEFAKVKDYEDKYEDNLKKHVEQIKRKRKVVEKKKKGKPDIKPLSARFRRM